jgi:hypothetical protein
MAKEWVMLDICAERTTVAGAKEVLVVWKPTWEPVEFVNTGAVWENWLAEQRADVARNKRMELSKEDDAAVVIDAGIEVVKRKRGRPPKMKVVAPTLVKVASAAVADKDGCAKDDDDDGSSSDDAPKSPSAVDAQQGISVLEASKGISILEAPKGISILKAPKGISVLDVPEGISVLEAPKGISVLGARKDISVLDAPAGKVTVETVKRGRGRPPKGRRS